jgi:hypothetical protein
LRDAHALVQALFGGWTVSWVYQYHGGPFLRFGALVVSGDPALPGGEKSRTRMFRTEAFAQQPAYTPRSNAKQYPGVHGPSYSNLDATLMKEVSVRERYKLEIRMECYNLTNSFMGGTVNVAVTNSQFGRVTAQRAGHYGRQFQYTARIRW